SIDETNMITTPNTLREAAVFYAKQGWAVIPLHHIDEKGNCSCLYPAKPVCKSAGKHPVWQDWGTHASTWPYVVENHWENYPKANIGLATGAKSGVVVLDIDTNKGKQGSESFKRLCQENNWQPSPSHPRARSGS